MRSPHDARDTCRANRVFATYGNSARARSRFSGEQAPDRLPTRAWRALRRSGGDAQRIAHACHIAQSRAVQSVDAASHHRPDLPTPLLSRPVETAGDHEMPPTKGPSDLIQATRCDRGDVSRKSMPPCAANSKL